MSALRGILAAVLLAATLAAPAPAEPDVEVARGEGGKISVVVRDAPLAEVFEMLARKERLNVLLGDGVDGNVSVNLFDVSVEGAVRSIADAAGFLAERRNGGFVIIRRDEAGKDFAEGNTRIRAFEIEHSDAERVRPIVEKHLSRYGEVTLLEDRSMLVVEDLPEFLHRIDALLAEIDRDPRLIFIEARILEIQLDEDESIGVDWEVFYEKGSFGVRDLAGAGSGFFFALLTSDIEIQLEALTDKGRVRTLSTPTLLAVEHEEAEVVIGDRLGFRVTTTINQVTTESVEFLESGVILRFTAAVDRHGRIVLDVHPEVSNGFILDGLPQQRTTEVTTRLRTNSGESIFIAGLIRDSETDRRTGIPFFMDIPILGRAFARTETVDLNTETVVILTAHVVDSGPPRNEAMQERVSKEHERLRSSREERSQRVVPVDPLTRSLGGVPFVGSPEAAPADAD